MTQETLSYTCTNSGGVLIWSSTVWTGMIGALNVTAGVPPRPPVVPMLNISGVTLIMPRAEAYGSSFVCLSVSHYAEGGATEAYCNRAVCQSVCQSVSLSFTSISRRSLKTKR